MYMKGEKFVRSLFSLDHFEINNTAQAFLPVHMLKWDTASVKKFRHIV